MKSIKLYLFSLFILLGVSTIMAQNDFYNEPETNNAVTEKKITTEKLNLEDNYYTESDYYDEVSSEQYESVDMFEEEVKDNEEIYSDTDDKKHKDRRDKNIGGEIAVEIVVEVLYNTLLFVALFWQ